MSVDESLMCSFQVDNSLFCCAITWVLIYVHSVYLSPHLILSFRSWNRQKKKPSTSTEGWIQDALSLRLAPVRHRKRGERLAQTLLLLPPAGVWPTSLQAASNTQSACSCVNRNSRSVFFACSVGIFMMWVVSFSFLLMPWCVLTQPSRLLFSPFCNIKTDILWDGQDVKKRCFSAFRLTISIVIFTYDCSL